MEIQVKYEGYIAKEQDMAAPTWARLDHLVIPEDLDVHAPHLPQFEGRQSSPTVVPARPERLPRISGVSPQT